MKSTVVSSVKSTKTTNSNNGVRSVSAKEQDNTSKEKNIETSSNYSFSREVKSAGIDAPNSNKHDTASTKKEEIEADNDWSMYIQPLLDVMNQYIPKRHNSIDQFCDACDNLVKELEQRKQLVSKQWPRRSNFLKIIFKFLDTENDRIRIKIANIILTMKVTSNNLTNICRLLFSISRNSENDIYFIESEKILESLVSSSKRLDFKENSDALIYFCGTMKNLSENGRILKQLSAINLEGTLLKIIKDLSKFFKDTSNNERIKCETGNALVQLTATLRNLADLSNMRQKLLSLNLIEELIYIVKYYTGDAELMLNISRILSKLTLHSDCCHRLMIQKSCYKSFIKILIKHDTKQDLIVRIAFILGNIMGRYEEARLYFIDEKYSLDTLVNTLKTFTLKDMDQTKHNQDKQVPVKQQQQIKDNEEINEIEPSPIEDILIKLVRVIANLAINEKAGTMIAQRNDLMQVLLNILGKI
jgi:armadillo repeat-containing protein 2